MAGTESGQNGILQISLSEGVKKYNDFSQSSACAGVPMSTLSEISPVTGFAAPGFEPVRAAFERNFTELADVGAAFAVARGGEMLVDLHGGHAAPGRPWAADTLMPIFSGTKGLVGTMMLMLIERGLLDLDRPVAHYWPEFAAHGKGGLRVRDIVSHHAGLPGITLATLTPADLTDDAAMEARLAAEPLSSDDRAFHCYHALTIGWLCGGVLRRIDGRSIGRFFAEEIAGPLGLDIHIGLPEALEPRVGVLELERGWAAWDEGLTPVQSADPTRRSIWGNPPLFGRDNLFWNSRAFHAAEIPGGGAAASAASMARFYAALAAGGAPLLRPETVREGHREIHRFLDPFIGEEMSIGTVYQLQTAQQRFGPPVDAFGHSGAGGSIHAAWPSQGIGLSYVMNEMRADPEERRTRAVLRALHEVLAG